MTYKAILIGNWTYDREKTGLQSLNGPQQDLEILKQALTDGDCGLFQPTDIKLVQNEDLTTVKQQLAEFLVDADKFDALFIYFSGHAVPHRNDLVLCMKETDPNRPLVQGLEFSFINKNLPDTRSEHTIVVLDCCYAGQSTKGNATVDLSFAQNLYCLASSGAYDLTPDAKSTGAASPFTAEFARLLVDPSIVADRRGAVTMDSVWAKLEGFRTKPVRSAAGRGSLLIARRGDLRDQDEQVLNPLEWLPKEPKLRQVDLTIFPDLIEAQWEAGTDKGKHLDADLREFVCRGLELLDGVGRLKKEEGVEQWRASVHHFWRLLGRTLIASALPKEVRNYIASRIDERAADDIVKIRIHSPTRQQGRSEADYEHYPWELLHGEAADPVSIQDFLSLAEGVVIERLCEDSKSFPKADEKLSYGIWSPHLSPHEKVISDQIVKELEARRSDLNLDTPPSNFISKDCNWTRFLGAAPVQLLVLTLPLRRLSDGTIEACFNSQGGPDWKRSDEILNRLSRWKVELKGVVIETVASYPSFNAYRAGVEFACQLTKAGIGPAAYLCHAIDFRGYPSDDRKIPVTFAGQLVCALLKKAEFAVAIHHARNAPLWLDSNIKETFGFPGYYWPKASSSGSGSGRLASKEAPSSGADKDDVKRGPKT